MKLFYCFQSVYNLLGETLTRLHQFEEAERWYQAALQVQPDHVPAHITYGKLLAKNVSNHVSTKLISIFYLTVIFHSNILATHFPQIVFLLIWLFKIKSNLTFILFQSSRVVEAEQWFRRAQRLAPDDPSVYHHTVSNKNFSF